MDTEIFLEKAAKFLLKPFWYTVFIIFIPILGLATAYTQTIFYNNNLGSIIGQQNPNYFELVFMNKSFFDKTLVIWFLMLLPFLFLGVLTKINNPKKDNRSDNLNFNSILKRLKRIFFEDWLYKLFAVIIINAISVHSGLVNSFGSDILLNILLIIVIPVLASLLSFKVGKDSFTIGNTLIILFFSIISIASILFYSKIIIAQNMHPILKEGMYDNITILLIIYFILVLYGIYIVTKFSISDDIFKEHKDRTYIIPLVLSAIFIVTAVYIINKEFQYRSDILFSDRMTKVFGSNIDMGTFRIYLNTHIKYRSIICLLTFTVIGTVLFSIMKIYAYYAMSKK